jgi:two-component system, OmpR family, phosphate regulon sensor histidine kinase PhoR
LGFLKLELASVDILRVAKGILEDFRNEANQQGLHLLADLPTTSPAIIADAGRLRQILGNLVSNAIKFTPRGGNVQISVQIKTPWIVLQVQDSGIGIAKSEHQKIFSKFMQVEKSLTREIGGVGLGLAIVKDLVQLHDGRVEVKSEVSKGSTFSVSLPIQGPKNPEKVAIQIPKESWAPPKVMGKK